MKKTSRILFSIVMALILILPFTAFGCSMANDNKQTITATANDANYGTVYGAGTFTEGETITLVAVPKDGYEFQKWNDDDTNSVRQIVVSNDGSHDYVATFVPETKYYALDKVEFYLEKYGTTTAKCVRLEKVDVNYQNQSICELGYGRLLSIDNGLILLHYNPTFDSYQVWATSDEPIYMYSMRNEYNVFEQGATPTFTVTLQLACAMGYYDNDNNFIEGNGSHLGSLAFNVAATVQPIGNNSTSTHLVYTDSNHGYKVFMRCNFVEL